MFIRLICFIFLSILSVSVKGDSIHILEDKERKLSAQQVYNIYLAGEIPVFEGNKLNKGMTSSVFWLAVSVPEHHARDKLIVGNPHINRVDFYKVINGRPELSSITGDHYPFKQRLVSDRLFVFPLSTDNFNNTYLVRVDKHYESLQLRAEVISDDEYYERRLEQNIIHALLSGVLVLIIVFGTFLFISFRDILYLYYVLYILAAFLWILTDMGYGYQFLWPESPYIASRSRLFLNLLFTVTLIQFMQAFIGQKRDSRWYQPLKVIKIINMIFAVLVLTVPHPTSEATEILYGFLVLHLTIDILTLIPFILSITEKIKEKNRQAWFYLISVVALLVCILAELIEQAGMTGTGTSFFQEYGVQTGIVIEAIILNFGLANRFNQYKNEREQLLVRMNQKQNELTEKIIETQEAERKRIAGQLHDEVGSLLSLVSLQISSVLEQKTSDQKTVLQLQKAGEVLHSVTDTVRNMSHTLMPLVIERYGFKNAIVDLQNNINLAGTINMECIIIGFDDRNKYDIQLLNDLYRIVQELANNIIKHAEATHALIQLIGYDEIISVMIEDNGKGLDNNQLKSGGIGLAGIQSKIDYFGGQIELSQKHDGGTLVIIEIPVK